jgi:hypothetical protein
MANTKFQLRRSTVPGKVPNTTHILTGELALNIPDKKLYSSNGTAIFEVGGFSNSANYLQVANAVPLIANNTTKYLEVSNSLLLFSTPSDVDKYLEVANVTSAVHNAGFVSNTYFTEIEAELKIEAAQQAANATANAIAFATAGGQQYLQVANAVPLIQNNTVKYLETANAFVYLEKANASIYMEKANTTVFMEVANLATVATSGSYDDLNDQPIIPSTTEFLQVANVSSYGFASNTYAASNTYVNARENAIFANVNPRIINVRGIANDANTKAVQALADAAAANTRAEGARTLAVSANSNLNSYKANVNPRIISAVTTAGTANTKAVQALVDAAAANTRAAAAQSLAQSSNNNLNSYKANVNPRIISVATTAGTANTKAVQALADAAAANTRAEGARTLAVSANSSLNAYKANVNPRIISVATTAGTANTKAVQALADAAAANTRAEGARVFGVDANNRISGVLSAVQGVNTALEAYKANTNPRFNLYLQVANAVAVIANNTTKYLEVSNTSALVQPYLEVANISSYGFASNTYAASNSYVQKYLEVSNASVYFETANTSALVAPYMQVANLANVATSADYNDLINKPPSTNTAVVMYKFFPTANQSIFTGNDNDGVPLAYTNTNVEVYLNGLKLIKNNDFRAPNTTHLSLYANAVSGDSVQVVSYQGTIGTASRFRTFTFTANSGQTTFNGTANTGGVLDISSTAEFVTLNGIVLQKEDDYTANTTHLILNEVTSNLDVLQVRTFGTLRVAEDQQYLEVANASSLYALKDNGTHTGNTSFDTDTLFVNSVNDRVGIGTSTTQNSSVVVTPKTNRGTIMHVASDSITNVGSAKMMEGAYTVVGNTSNIVLSIPVTSQGSVWKSYFIELNFITGEYNKSGAPLAGYCKLSLHSLTSLNSLTQHEVGGNVSSVSSSGMNILINFTTGYISGLSDNEGVLVYAKVLSNNPDYIQLDNATLN